METKTSTHYRRVDDANSDNDFDPVADQQFAATTTDNDVAGFTVAQTGGSTSVSESGTTDTFTIVLNAQPASNVVIAILLAIPVKRHYLELSHSQTPTGTHLKP